MSNGEVAAALAVRSSRRNLVLLDDHVTTDILPAGSIPSRRPTGQYLVWAEIEPTEKIKPMV